MIYLIKVLNSSLTTVATFFDFISCIWTTQYFAPGEFELVVEYSAENMTRLAVGNYIVKNGGNEIGVIEKVRYDYSPDEGGTITASGRLGVSLLARRLMYTYGPVTHRPLILTYCSDNQKMEVAARSAVDLHCINPSGSVGPSRVITNLVLGTLKGYNETAKKRVSTYQNLYSALTAFLATKGLAHRIVFDESQGKLVYEVFKGTNRSSSMVFSRYLENLLSFAYEYDKTEYKNFIYIGGDGEGRDRFVTSTTMNNYTPNVDRREVFYGASSNLEENQTPDSYNAVLINEAKQECRQYAAVTSVEAEIDLVGSGYEFGTDYNVGDIILIKDIVDFKPRITTVIESQSADGYTVNVEFNEDAPEEEEE